MPLIHADLAEAKAPAQGAAGRVLWKDAGDELPEAALRALVQQALQHGASDPYPARGTSDVHREFRDAGVTGAGTVGTGGCPGHHLPVTLDDNGRVPVAALGQLGLDLLRMAWLRLKRRDTICDALVVDVGDGRSVRVRALPDRRHALLSCRRGRPPASGAGGAPCCRRLAARIRQDAVH